MASGTGETGLFERIQRFIRERTIQKDVYENLINNEYRIVLVGTAGNGKSSTGNTLLDKTPFQAQSSASAITVKCAKAEAEFYGKRVLVVDTPGYYDLERSEEDIHEEVKNCIGMITPGPHIIVLVTKASGRFTHEQHNTLQLVIEHFGEKALKYMMVLFTHIDCLDGITFDQYIQTSPALLKKVLQMCDNNFIGFSNKATGNKRLAQRNDFFRKVDAIVQKNGGSHYTNKLLREVEEVLKEKMNTQKQLLDKKSQRVLQSLEEKVDTYKKKNESLMSEKELYQTLLDTKMNSTNDRLVYERKIQNLEETFQAAKISNEHVIKEMEQKYQEREQKMKEELQQFRMIYEKKSSKCTIQ